MHVWTGNTGSTVNRGARILNFCLSQAQPSARNTQLCIVEKLTCSIDRDEEIAISGVL